MINKIFSQNEFDELCKYVCYQLSPSGSAVLDIETINYAIYWQICRFLGKPLECEEGETPKIQIYRQKLINLLHDRQENKFDALQILDKNIAESVTNRYYRQASMPTVVSGGADDVLAA